MTIRRGGPRLLLPPPPRGSKALQVLLKTPDNRFALFDTDHFDFEHWGLETPEQFELVRETVWPSISPALMDAERRLATDDLPWRAGLEWPRHPLGLGRWEHALESLVLETTLEYARHLLRDIELAGYLIPARIVEAGLEAEADAEKRRLEEAAWAARAHHNPIVDSTRDESVWNEI